MGIVISRRSKVFERSSSQVIFNATDTDLYFIALCRFLIENKANFNSSFWGDGQIVLFDDGIFQSRYVRRLTLEVTGRTASLVVQGRPLSAPVRLVRPYSANRISAVSSYIVNRRVR